MSTFAPVTLGKTLASQDLGGFILTDTVHEPSVALSSHAHEHAAVSIVVRGLNRQTFRGGEIVCGPGTVLLEPAGQEHSTVYGAAPTRTFILEMRPDHRPTPGKELQRTYRTAHSAGLQTAMERLAAECVSPGSLDAGYAHALAIDVAAELACHAAVTGEAALARLVRDYVYEYFASGVRLDDLALLTGRHPTHLCRAFRCTYGVAIGDFIRSVQVRHALRALSLRSDTLTEIALGTGFSDQSHFGRVFRAHTGLTPGAYRRLARKQR